MDISVRIFMDADEFICLLQRASALGCTIHYPALRGRPSVFAKAREPLPRELETLLRSPLDVESPHTIFVRFDGEAIESQRTICAYFGGFDTTALYLTSVTVRSIDESTLTVARQLKRSLVAISRTGVRVIGGRPAATVRLTTGAELAVKRGLVLSAGGNVRYEIIQNPV